MNEAPERIWAVTEPNDISADTLGDVYAQQIPDGMTGTPVKYFRADHIEELEAKLANKCVRADRIEELGAKLAKAVEALEECVEEIDAYIQIQYPDDNPFQEIYRQRDYATNPARLALAEIKGETDNE